MIYGYNKKIACVPPEQKGAELKVAHGMAVIQHRSSLMALRVVFGNEGGISPGFTIYLPEQLKQQPWASQVYEINGQKFILVPEEQIVLVDETTPSRENSQPQPISRA